jgi:hypothetical protein
MASQWHSLNKSASVKHAMSTIPAYETCKHHALKHSCLLGYGLTISVYNLTWKNILNGIYCVPSNVSTFVRSNARLALLCPSRRRRKCLLSQMLKHHNTWLIRIYEPAIRSLFLFSYHHWFSLTQCSLWKPIPIKIPQQPQP